MSQFAREIDKERKSFRDVPTLIQNRDYVVERVHKHERAKNNISGVFEMEKKVSAWLQRDQMLFNLKPFT